MKIGGRIILAKNIRVYTSIEFSATYKRHYINVKLYRELPGQNPEWDCDVRHYDGGIAVNTIIQRCSIHDAIVYALDGSLL